MPTSEHRRAEAPRPRRPGPDDFLAAARLAAPAWGVEPTSIEILSVSENVVCDVALRDGRHVVLRLHRPGYNTLDELRSEVQWVESLAASGVPVARPLATIDGAHHVPVEVGGEQRFVGMVDWVDGHPLERVRDLGPDVVVGRYGQIGELAARIRRHGTEWERPAGFVRRRWDADGLVGHEPLWGRFWAVDGLTGSQQRSFAAARAALHEELSAKPTSTDRFGLIHADLHLNNVMADGDRLTVIDFDDAGYGWYAYELAVALHHVLDEPWFDEARAELVAGYRRWHPLTEDEERLVDAFLCVRCLLIVGWLAARPELGLGANLPVVAGEAERMVARYRAMC